MKNLCGRSDEAVRSDLTATVTYLLRTSVCISHHVLIRSLFIFLSSEVQELLRQLQKHRCRFSEQLLPSHQLPFVLDLSHKVGDCHFGDLKFRCSAFLKGCNCDHLKRFTVAAIKTFIFLHPPAAMCEKLAILPKIMFFNWRLTTANCTGLLRRFRLLTSEHLRNVSSHVLSEFVSL